MQPGDHHSESGPLRDDAIRVGPNVPVARPVSYGPPTARAATTLPIPQDSHDFLLRSSRRSEALLDCFLLIAAILIIEVLSHLLLSAALNIPADEKFSDEAARAVLLPSLTLRAAGVFLVIPLLLKWRGQTLASIGVTARGFWLNIPIGLGASILAWLASIGILLPLMLIWPEMQDQMTENAENITNLFPRMDTLLMLRLMLVVGLWEEVVFRGFLLTRLRRATGHWIWAMLISLVLFVVPHMADQTLPAMLPIACIGVVYSLVTIWRRSIVPAIVGHAAFNAAQLINLSWLHEGSWV